LPYGNLLCDLFGHRQSLEVHVLLQLVKVVDVLNLASELDTEKEDDKMYTIVAW
jgi:hypothetical protein